MRYIILLGLLLGLCFQVKGQGVEWYDLQHIYKISKFDMEVDINDNAYVGYGGCDFFCDSNAVWVKKFSHKGKLLWKRFIYLPVSGRRVSPPQVSTDSNLNVYLCFVTSVNVNPPYNILPDGDKINVIKYNRNGDSLTHWEFNLNYLKQGMEPANIEDFFATTSTFSFFLISWLGVTFENIPIAPDSLYQDVTLVKTDHYKNVLWTWSIPLWSVPFGTGGTYQMHNQTVIDKQGNYILSTSAHTYNTKDTFGKCFLYKISPQGKTLQQMDLTSGVRLPIIAISLSPRGKICALLRTDSSFILEGKVVGNNLLLVISDDLKIEKYIPIKGKLRWGIFNMDAFNNMYIYFYCDTCVIGDSTIIPNKGFRGAFLITDSTGWKIKLISETTNSFNYFNSKFIASPCRSVYWAIYLYDTIYIGSVTIAPYLKEDKKIWYSLLVSFEDEIDTLNWNLSIKCEGTLACGTIGSQSFNNFYWDFGDGNTSNKSDPIHQYKQDGSHVVRLVASTPYGCTRVFIDTLQMPLPPNADFDKQDSIGCQWVGFRFLNYSKTDTVKAGGKMRYQWDFGDGTIDSTENPLHIYTQPGKYSVSLIADNGFCTDTMTRTQVVEILAAPKPGFSLSVTSGCAPLEVKIEDRSVGAITGRMYYSGSGDSSTLPFTSFIYTKPGVYTIIQHLTGPTGCVTQDSLQVEVFEGVAGNILAPPCVTITDNQTVAISWQLHNSAIIYHLHRQIEGEDWKLLASTAGNSYIDGTAPVNSKILYYKLYAQDTCGNMTAEGEEVSTIRLKGINHANQSAILNWNQPSDDIQQYCVFREDLTGNLKPVYCTSANLYRDDSFYQENMLEQCYQVFANRSNGCISASTRQCVPYIPAIFIPNAFTPGNDSLNEQFCISTVGITSLELRIYDRWGRLISNSNNSCWSGKEDNGTPCNIGPYLYIIRGRGIDNESYYRSGTLHLLR